MRAAGKRFTPENSTVVAPEGWSIAEVIKYRHETLRAFLTLIRVPEVAASRDACIMEHEISPETIEQIRHFVPPRQGYPDFRIT